MNLPLPGGQKMVYLASYPTGMLELELTPPVVQKCECCDHEMVILTRFVYKNGQPHGIAHIKYTRGHPDKVLVGLVSLGNFAQEIPEPERVAFPVRMWDDERQYCVGFLEDATEQWRNMTVLGKILTREQARAHPRKPEVFDITDLLTAEDPEVKKYFRSNFFHQ